MLVNVPVLIPRGKGQEVPIAKTEKTMGLAKWNVGKRASSLGDNGRKQNQHQNNKTLFFGCATHCWYWQCLLWCLFQPYDLWYVKYKRGASLEKFYWWHHDFAHIFQCLFYNSLAKFSKYAEYTDLTIIPKHRIWWIKYFTRCRIRSRRCWLCRCAISSSVTLPFFMFWVPCLVLSICPSFVIIILPLLISFFILKVTFCKSKLCRS